MLLVPLLNLLVLGLARVADDRVRDLIAVYALGIVGISLLTRGLLKRLAAVRTGIPSISEVCKT